VIILDTNVTSELMRSQPDAAVIAWFAAQPPRELFSTVITTAEISYGLERLPRGRRRKSLEQSYQSIFVAMADQILLFDVEAALLYGPLVAGKERAGTAMDPMDAQIACIAACRGATIATPNERDFADCGVRLVNPWRHGNS
jgi:toxin FitB